MTDIPEYYLSLGRDLAKIGCSCEDADEAEFSCPHFKSEYHYCTKQEEAIAAALEAARGTYTPHVAALEAENTRRREEITEEIRDAVILYAVEDGVVFSLGKVSELVAAARAKALEEAAAEVESAGWYRSSDDYAAWDTQGEQVRYSAEAIRALKEGVR